MTLRAYLAAAVLTVAMLAASAGRADAQVVVRYGYPADWYATPYSGYSTSYYPAYGYAPVVTPRVFSPYAVYPYYNPGAFVRPWNTTYDYRYQYWYGPDGIPYGQWRGRYWRW